MRFLLLCCVLKTIVYSCEGFQTNIIHPQSRLNNEGARLRLKPPSRLNPLSAGDDDNNEPEPTKRQFGGRFINPRIDDIGLPLADSLISGIVGKKKQPAVSRSLASKRTSLVNSLHVLNAKSESDIRGDFARRLGFVRDRFSLNHPSYETFL